MINDTLNREIDYKGPAWATERRDAGDGDPPWFAAPVGRGYTVPGVGAEVTDIGQGDGAMTFELLNCPNESVSGPETYIDQACALGGLNAAFASADAMRRYARVLLEVADDVERVLGVAR